MAVTFGSAATSGFNTGSPTTVTFACTTVSADTRLVVYIGKPTGGTAPTGVTYNGVALTPDGNAAQGFNLSVWHLDNPPAGTFNVIATNSVGCEMVGIAIPLRGVDLTKAPTLGTATTGSSASASCTAPVAGANDMQLAIAMVVSNTLSSAGAPQSVVPSSPTMPVLNFSSTGYSFSSDSLTLGSNGVFGWTLTSGTWNAWGSLIKAGATGPQYITKWTPFRWACAMRSLQQGANNVGNRQQNRAALLASAITNANGAATWAKWRVGENSRVSSCGLMLNVPLVPGFVPPVGTVDDGT